MNVIKEILFSEEQIKARVAEIGKQISKDYAGKEVLIVGILRGSIIFVADLIRNVTCDCVIDFMTISSYRDGISSGELVINEDLHSDIKGKHVIVVEDILDTAKTLSFVKSILLERKPASLKICTLLDKKVPKCADVTADYKCFDVDDKFVVGYGLDYAQKYRNLPFIGVLKDEIYKNK